MKIVIVLPYLTNIGGAARYGWELSEYLARKGDQVIIISLYTDRILYHSKEEIKIIDLAERDSFTQSLKFWFNLEKISEKLSSLIKTIKPDIVLFNHFPSTLWVKDYGSIPTLCYPQDIDLLYSDTYTKNLTFPKYIFWKVFRLYVRYYDRKKWKYFDQVISNSEFSAHRISKKYYIKPTVIYPGTNTEFFIPSKDHPKERVILLIADHKTRRADFFLKNIKKIYQKRKDFQIWIVGSTGNYHEKLEKIVKKEEISKIVRFFGRVSDADLAKLYSQALVLVHLQKIHPFGLVFIESLSCGTPVIACKPGATEEVIQHEETGFLINEDDSNSLRKYLEKFLDDPKLSVTMGEKGRLIVKKNFEMEAQYEKVRSLMLDWINKKS